jgi:branched-chain amino acid transport system substrate-binding protein
MQREMETWQDNCRSWIRPWVLSFLLATCGLVAGDPAGAAEPIRFGFAMALSGGVASTGKSALVAMEIWRKDVNAKGGILGRPVEFVYYDDQSSPSNVPAIYAKLIGVDKVDIVMSNVGSDLIAPAMPVVMQYNKLFVGLIGIAVNSNFHYPKYFAMIPLGENGTVEFSKGFFEVALKQNPKPQTVAIVSANTWFGGMASDGARENAKAGGLKVVHDRSYPPGTVDFSPILRAAQATNPDIIYVASYPAESVGIVRTAHEIGLKAKLFGGGMVGLQNTPLKTQLGPLLNGVVAFDWWLPAPKLQFPGIMNLLENYQAKAASEGVDTLGYYTPPLAYAYLQVVQQAIEATKSLDQDKLADYIRSNTLKTVVGDLKFGKDGEWAEPRVLQVQFRDITGNDVDQFRRMDTQAIVWPEQYKTGELVSPYEAKR